ncbi:MAG: DNA polymerase [Thermoplasmatota archaeon]
MQHNFHKFRKNDDLKMQNSFIFVDTEAYREFLEKGERQTFRLCCAIYWKRDKNVIERKDFFSTSDFWNWVESKFEYDNNLIFFAHNTDYDFRILNGFNELMLKDWDLSRWFISGRTFIITYKKIVDGVKHYLNIWDTLNYVPSSLKELGECVGIPKMEIDFDNVSEQELLRYCQNDVNIIFHFIKEMISFLEEYELSKLMPTSASLSLNIFRHKFYDANNPIIIHDWKKTIELEREAYGGGITDCFQVGDIDETVYKLDINSMYPYIMKNYDLPVKLLFWERNSSGKLLKLYHQHKKEYLVIARCTIYIPEEYSYILQKAEINNEEKNVFLSGRFTTVLTSPEIEFVEQYGILEEIHELAIYEKRNVFSEFVDFFYSQRMNYKKDGDKVREYFCKLILNSQYGKWGQKNIEQKLVAESDTSEISHHGHFLGFESKSFEVVQFGKKVYKIINKGNNSKDAFVAIPAFITAYSRMLLVKYILQAKRENVFYCDTDSLFVNKNGYNNLISVINDTKLGKLKLEDQGTVSIYAPKHYIFNEQRKCKGIKSNAVLKDETDSEFIFEQQRWERFKTAFKKQHLDYQLIEPYEIRVTKEYKKGTVEIDKRIRPLEIWA